MSEPRRHDPEGSREAILDAAGTLFLEYGFAGTTLSQIAKRSGITKSLIHHHFGTKDCLWAEVKRRRFGRFLDQQRRQMSEIEPWSPQFMRGAMRTFFASLRDNPSILRLKWWRLLEGEAAESEADVEVAESLRALILDHIRADQRKGYLRSDLTAECIFLAFLGLVHAWWQEPSLAREVDATRYLDAAWSIFIAGVGTGLDMPHAPHAYASGA